MSETLPAGELDAARQRGAEVLREGQLVVGPTDTVYGVFADAFSMEATQRLFQARGAARNRPLTVFVRSPRQLSGLAAYTSEQAERLIAAFWPGALTIVLEANEGLAWDLGDSAGTVAVRMPAEELVYELVAEIGPLACSAACPVGGVPPRTVDAAREQLGDVAGLYLDGGWRPGGASTIVDCSRGGAEVLRAGGVSADDIFRVATGVVAWGRPAGPPGEAPEPGAGEAEGPEPGAGEAEAPEPGAGEPEPAPEPEPEPASQAEPGRQPEPGPGEAPGPGGREA